MIAEPGKNGEAQVEGYDIVELKDGKVSLIREGSISFKEIEETFYRR